MAIETERGSMTGDEMVALTKRHTLYEWSAQSKVDPIPVAGAKGSYFWTPEGKRYLDFNSQLMCVNIGHGHPKVIEAIERQAEKLAYANPFMATEPRARLAAKLAEITPGDIDVFFFTNGGAEANENAIKLARFYTGRHKILARYRSYHGGTAGAITLTGDPRRWAAEPGIPGRGPRARSRTTASSAAGTPPRTRSRNLEETIQLEGPSTIAGVHPGDRGRHERRARAARRLPAGRPRALRSVRDPDDRGRGDGRLRSHRQVVRGRPLGRGARPHHDGQGPDQRVRAARARWACGARSPTASRTASSTAASPTTRTRWRAPRRWRRSRCSRTRG